jgi:hypothetical protein
MASTLVDFRADIERRHQELLDIIASQSDNSVSVGMIDELDSSCCLI